MSGKASIADRLFDSRNAESELEDALSEAGCTFESLGWDWYDCSLEIHGVDAGDRLSEAAQRVVHGAGFGKVYVNHKDKWETHYSFDPNGDFVASEGWRVSYPHKRGEDQKGIWVEQVVPGWPKDWFKSGHAIVKPALRLT